MLRLLGKALFSGLEESEGGLEELFERVHFGMFFILLIFLLQTCILVCAREAHRVPPPGAAAHELGSTRLVLDDGGGEDERE